MIDSSFSLQSGRRLSTLIVAMRRVAARLLSAIASRGSLPRWGASKTWNRTNAPPRMMQRDRCDGEMQLLHEAIYRSSFPISAAAFHSMRQGSSASLTCCPNIPLQLDPEPAALRHHCLHTHSTCADTLSSLHAPQSSLSISAPCPPPLSLSPLGSFRTDHLPRHFRIYL